MTETRLPFPDPGPKTLATGQRAMVSTSNPQVTQAAVDVLRAGGNAIDALLTAMPLQFVLEPQMSTMAGGFAALYWEAKTGKATYINANLDHPTGSRIPPAGGVPESSGQRVGVPGTPRGMQALFERYGTRPWASYFEPAIEAAENGFEMYSFLYGEMALAHDRITYYPSGRAFFTPLGYPTPVGQLHRQPALAATLRRMAEDDGVEWFQEGEFARAYVEAVNATGGTLSLEDMANFEVRWQEPLAFSFQGQQFLSSPAPDYGGFVVAFTLGVLERAGLTGDHWTTEPRDLALIARAMATAEEHALRYIQDPKAFDVPVETLLSDAYLQTQATLITGSLPTVDLTPPAPVLDRGGVFSHDDPTSTDSNHIVIVDEQGNWLTMLHTVFGTPFGTGLVVKGISTNSGNGFPGVSVGPGRRLVTPLTPLMGMHDGRPVLAVGSPGQATTAVNLFLINRLRYQQEVQAAIDAPRFRFQPARGSLAGWEQAKLAVETRIPEATLREIARQGIEPAPLGDFNWHLGSLQAVLRDPESNTLTGAADPRRCGYAAGY